MIAREKSLRGNKVKNEPAPSPPAKCRIKGTQQCDGNTRNISPTYPGKQLRISPAGTHIDSCANREITAPLLLRRGGGSLLYSTEYISGYGGVWRSTSAKKGMESDGWCLAIGPSLASCAGVLVAPCLVSWGGVVGVHDGGFGGHGIRDTASDKSQG